MNKHLYLCHLVVLSSPSTKELSRDVKQFRLVLKRFIMSNSFYSLEEYFDINWK